MAAEQSAARDPFMSQRCDCDAKSFFRLQALHAVIRLSFIYADGRRHRLEETLAVFLQRDSAVAYMRELLLTPGEEDKGAFKLVRLARSCKLDGFEREMHE